MVPHPSIGGFLIILIHVVVVHKHVHAHSHLAQPLPTRELHCRVGAQQGRDCYGPCPLPDDYGRLNHLVSAEHPAEVWGRGQSVTIRWHRNNRKSIASMIFHVTLFFIFISCHARYLS